MDHLFIFIIANKSLVTFYPLNLSSASTVPRATVTVMRGSSSSSLRSVETLLKLVILPSESEHPMDAVKAQLNDMLFSYNDDLEGVPMVYYDIKLPPGKNCGRILNDSPWLHIDILVELLLFQPSPGQTSIGQINKVGVHTSLIFHVKCHATSFLYSQFVHLYGYGILGLGQFCICRCALTDLT